MLIRDYKLRSADEATMRAALAGAGITAPDGAAPGDVIEQQVPQWSIAWLGTLYNLDTGVPLTGWHADLRWIGPDAPDLSAIEITPEPAAPQHGWA